MRIARIAGWLAGIVACLAVACAGREDTGGANPPASKIKAKAKAKAKAIFDPDMPVEKLRKTMLFSSGIHSSVKVEFCVDTKGRVPPPSIASSSGDPGVDEIALETVASWRFEPYVENGVVTETCSEVQFMVAIHGSEPESLDSLVASAVLLQERGEMAEARAAADEAFAAEPARHDVLGARAIVLEAEGDVDGASALVEQCLAAFPRGPFCLYAKARLAQRRGEHTLARSTYERVIQLEPRLAGFARARLAGMK